MQAATPLPREIPISAADPAVTVQGLLIFVVGGILMVLVALLAGKLLRRSLPHPVKADPYECGEPAIGQSWVQFDLRAYVPALIFLVFAVEIALFWPWAVVFREAGLAGLVDMLFFVVVLGAGYVYLWRFGDLEWVRSTAGQRSDQSAQPPRAEPPPRAAPQPRAEPRAANRASSDAA